MVEKERTDPVISWLLEGDPAIRWQVMRDLLDEPERIHGPERRKTESQGWGARLLSCQDPSGLWAKSLYNRKWISATYTLLHLCRLGLPEDNLQARSGCARILESNIARDGGINYWPSFKQSETCVTGMTLFFLAYFRTGGESLHAIADHLVRRQMEDGGWNCQMPKGATHGSFHTTINVLEGLLEYEKAFTHPPVRTAGVRAKAQEFLLVHRLFRSHRTGRQARSVFTQLSFPPHWYYDILRSLDYFREARAAFDSRMDDALGIIRKKRREDGFWPLQANHPGKTWFEMETPGMPSRWNTLRALRVLRAFEGYQGK